MNALGYTFGTFCHSLNKKKELQHLTTSANVAYGQYVYVLIKISLSFIKNKVEHEENLPLLND